MIPNENDKQIAQIRISFFVLKSLLMQFCQKNQQTWYKAWRILTFFAIKPGCAFFDVYFILAKYDGT